MPARGQGRRQVAARRIQAAWRSRRPRPKRSRKIPLALQPHTFCERSGSDTLVIGTEASAVGLFKNFEFSHITQWQSYTAIFEQYKLNKIVVEFRYKSIAQPAYDNSLRQMNEINPVLYFKVDHNDADQDSLVDLKKSIKTKEHQFTNNNPNFTITLKPAVLLEDTNVKGAIGTNYRPKWGVYLDTNEVNVEHHGLKAYCVGGVGGSTQPGSLEVTYKTYFTMKNND